MKIVLLCVGKTTDDYISTGVENYMQRINHYFNFSIEYIPLLKNSSNMPVEVQKTKESQMIFKFLSKNDTLVLLDEKGRQYNSVEFAGFISQLAGQSVKRLVFCIGGPYGFSDDMHKLAAYKISLSKMTFSHQLVRLVFAEQLYRACTIIKGEPYHHE